MSAVPTDHASADFAGELFDFQINGFAGVDFQQENLDSASLRHAVDALQRHGCGHFFLTLITDDIDKLCRKLERLERCCGRDARCREAIAGYHLEGPWLNAEEGYRGAHPVDPMHPPRAGEFDKLQAAAVGRIRLVTLAPELPDSDAFIAKLTRSGVHVSLGHTNGSESEIDAAIAAGARFCTHLGNATPLLLARHDNVIQRLLARDELTACFIPDGCHLPPSVLKNLFRAKPPGRALFTTDAMAGAAAPAGTHTLGPLRVEVGVDGVARQPAGGGFAGSTLTPAEGVRRTARYLGLSPAEAKNLWSEAPLRAFGLPRLTATS